MYIEITKSEHGHGGRGWEFGTCLWGSSRNKAGVDRYAIMRETKKGDLVLHFYHEDWQVLCEYDGSDTFSQWYAYGNYIDEVLVKSTSTNIFVHKYYVHDHLYSPAALINFLGAVQERYEYDAYGNCTIWDSGWSTERATSSYNNPYYFTGRRLDTLDNSNGALEIMYYRNRYYDTYTGRFLQHDPLGITPCTQPPNYFKAQGQYSETMNVFEYAQSNPVIYDDALGLLTKSCCKKLLPSWLRRPEIRFLYITAKNKRSGGGWWGKPCLKNIKCGRCPAGWRGKYNPRERESTICTHEGSGHSAPALRKTLAHELIHAIDLCGRGYRSCGDCMIHEKRARYHAGRDRYHAGQCTTPANCTRRAWDSCTAGDKSPCDKKKETYWKYINVGGWPPAFPR